MPSTKIPLHFSRERIAKRMAEQMAEALSQEGIKEARDIPDKLMFAVSFVVEGDQVRVNLSRQVAINV